MQRMLLYPVSQQHRNTARLSLITNNVVQIFQDHCSGGDEWLLCGELWRPLGVIILTVYIPVCVLSGLRCFQTWDDYKQDRSVCLLLSWFQKATKEQRWEGRRCGVYGHCEWVPAQLQQQIRSFKCLVLRGLSLVAAEQVNFIISLFFT